MTYESWIGLGTVVALSVLATVIFVIIVVIWVWLTSRK
jgi:hypothetical protein